MPDAGTVSRPKAVQVHQPGRCIACGVVLNTGYAARAKPGVGLIEVCSAACAAKPAFNFTLTIRKGKRCE